MVRSEYSPDSKTLLEISLTSLFAVSKHTSAYHPSGSAKCPLRTLSKCPLTMVVNARKRSHCGDTDPDTGSLVASHVDLGGLLLAVVEVPLCYHALRAREIGLVDEDSL